MAPDLARRIDADDIVQSVFRTFFRRAALGQYEVPAGGDLWKLLLVMALNKIRSVATHHRSARRDIGRTSGDDAAGVAVADHDDNAAVATLRMTIEELLCDLPESHRAIIELRIDGHEVADIARKVARSKRSVERALREFRDQLQAALEA
jgi:RNA polymerase sigma-70 factor (ECF subfamily)